VTPVVDRYELGMLATNAYVVRANARAREAVVVDPADEAARLHAALDDAGARCAAILVTHCHWDHLLGVADLAEGTGAPVYMSATEAPVLEAPETVYAGRAFPIRPYSADVRLDGDETLELAGLTFQTLRVPGHSPGHLAFHVDGALLSGDVLFAGSVGRADIPGADWDTLLESIRLLVERFPPDTVVYPGHGPPTTLGAELARNPFLSELRA
jgi:glyoxylase-like metal-dependent hydrolase (beta-lactamase superfamily II)